jgi:endonuclease G
MEPTSDQDDLSSRPGYQPDFLGAVNVIPLPAIFGVNAGDVLEVVGGGHELRYWTYSVLMSRSRRLPFLSTANYDRNSWAHDRRANVWAYDPRLDESAAVAKSLQVGDTWYEHQNGGFGRGEFDKGHLTAFENADWGNEHARNGADTFHYTNCAPQAKEFNEHRIWREIEVWAADQGTSGIVSLFNGPIYDAPTSTPLDSGEFRLNPSAASTADPILNGLRIPKQYFKVAAYVQSVGLAVQAFVMTQEGYLPRLRATGLTGRELSLYRVPLSVVTHLTGVDFGPLAELSKSINHVVDADLQLIKTVRDLG